MADDRAVERASAVLAAHVMVNGFDECGDWFSYACACSATGDSDDWHRAHVAEALASAGLLRADTAEPARDRATIRQRIVDWLRSTSETYAGPVGGDAWIDGLTSYLLHNPHDADTAEPVGLRADAWDEGFEAAVEWVERCGRPADIGPPDPPLNPYSAALAAADTEGGES